MSSKKHKHNMMGKDDFCPPLLNPIRIIHEKNMQKRLKYDKFSLITQICIGGIMYHMLGVQFQSPTVDLWFTGEDYIKLVENPRKYIQDLEPFPIMEDYKEEGKLPYPVIGVGDIKLYCMHYTSCEEAIEAWKRRRERVDYNKLMAIATEWDMGYDKDLIARFLALPYPKVLFTKSKMEDENTVFCTEKAWNERAKTINVPLLTCYKHGYKRCFEEVFDVVDWINRNANTD